MSIKWLSAPLALLLVPAFAAGALAERPRATYVKVQFDKSPEVLAAGERRIIFMNRNGGTYIPGPDDSSANMSSIIGSVGTIPPYPYGDASWNLVMQCEREMFARFNIEVTDVDPGSVAHIESVIGGQSSDVGFPPTVGGVSPQACGIIDRGINYTFMVWGNDPQVICETAAQEISHTFGLEHEMECHDPLSASYVAPCGDGLPLSFQDVDSACVMNDGSGIPFPTCACTGAATQNTVQYYYAKVGAGETEPPVLTVTQPTEGQDVAPGFQVISTVTDNIGVQRVDLNIDGTFVANANSPPYTITAPASLPIGPHVLQVVAYDTAGNSAMATINITLMTGCTVNDDCTEDGYICAGGLCLGDVGAACDRNADCAASICAPTTMFGGICTIVCDPNNSTCPDGFECNSGPTGGTLDKCFPAEGGGGGCGCVAGTRGRAGSALLGLLMCASVLLVVRLQRGRR